MGIWKCCEGRMNEDDVWIFWRRVHSWKLNANRVDDALRVCVSGRLRLSRFVSNIGGIAAAIGTRLELGGSVGEKVVGR